MASKSQMLEERARQLTEQLKESERKREEIEREIEESKRKIEESERNIKESKRKLEESERKRRPSQFLDYVQHIEEAVFSAFAFDQNPSKAASGAGTDVGGKIYPRFLRPWTDFAERHKASFDLLRSSLDGQALFPSPDSVETLRWNIIRRHGSANDSIYDNPFIMVAVEEPAAAIVTAHLKAVQPDAARSVYFRNDAYGMLPNEGPPFTRPSSSKEFMPNRWAFLHEEDDKATHVLIGQYKLPRKLDPAILERVMETRPGDTFFSEAICFAQTQEEEAASSAMVSGHVQVAKVLCQTYHYMIGAGCEYSYIASGNSFVVFRVPQDTPDTLYYHSVRFAVPLIRDPEERRRQNVGLRAAHETAMAYMATLCLWATETMPRLLQWSEDVRRSSLIWPSKEELDNGSRSMSYGSDGGSTTREEILATRPANGTKIAEPEALEARKTTFFAFCTAEPPTLQYCTQACLRGLAHGLALDNSCPNVALHRAAREQNSRAAVPSTEAHAELQDGHPLTLATLQSRVVAQIAANMSKDVDCLDKYGYYGRYGVLFKIAVTGYGYVFVGKSVTEGNRNVLDSEAAVYETIPHLQGRLVPIFLGVVQLERPIPRLFTKVTDMLLLSYAGHSLDYRSARPSDVDWESEMDRTTWELEKAGIYNDDVRDCNVSWNAEVGRVMHFDFDRAEVFPRAPEPAAALEDRPTVEPKVEPSTTTSVKTTALTACSPLLDKSDWNASHSSNDASDGNDDGRVAKRMRMDRDVEDGPNGTVFEDFHE